MIKKMIFFVLFVLVVVSVIQVTKKDKVTLNKIKETMLSARDGGV